MERAAPGAAVAMLTTFSEQAYVARAHVGASLSNPEIAARLHLVAPMAYAIAVARGARDAIANARGTSRPARHHARTNSAANSGSPASVHTAGACCTNVRVARAKSAVSRQR
ncbi:hypothetical protein O3S80_31120 [Streptomyces sp. Lzd4kr]|nr:hypothetical protein [Streptomyces sp. Lzd4kr]